MMVGVACISMHDNNKDMLLAATVPTENITPLSMADSSNIPVLIGGILGAVMFLVVAMTCIILFCCIKQAKKDKIDL